MNQVLEYNGFIGSIEISLEDNVLFGSLLYINDLITYEGKDIQELRQAFEEAVDDYILFCEECEKEPEKPFKGSFNVRIAPELHKAAVYEAQRRGKKLNQFVGEAIKRELEAENKNSMEHREISEKIEDVGNRFDEAFTAMNRNFAFSSAVNLVIKKGEISND